ncbi:Amiloride-sensitive amine oxidase [copper-containing] [Schistosoma japonicum]|nr:Amiloride-sensitive amine oxidase [copper-containing] [Schistosoma japonicum]
MSRTEFPMKSSNELQSDQYRRLLNVQEELVDNSNSQELSLFNDKTDAALSDNDNNNSINNNHGNIIHRKNWLKLILLLLFIICTIFPIIYFIFYTLTHCNPMNSMNTNDTYIHNYIISLKSNQSILTHYIKYLLTLNSTTSLSSLITQNSSFNETINNSNLLLSSSSSIETLNNNENNSLKQNYVNFDYGIFDEPNEEEYENVVNYLRLKFITIYAYSSSSSSVNSSNNTLMNKTWSEQLKMNLLWSLNLFIPNKTERLNYFTRLRNPSKHNNNEEYERYGIVIIFFGSYKIPIIKEYFIGPLKKPSIMKLLNVYPFYKRPLTNIEYNAILDYLAIQTSRIDQIIQEAYSASYFMYKPMNNYWLYKYNQTWFNQFNESNSLCQSQANKHYENIHGRPNCLIPMFASPLVTSHAPNRRRVWIRLCRDVTPIVHYPVDIHFHIDQTSLEPDEWILLQIQFQEQLFSSIDELLSKYHSGKLKITKHPFVDMYPNQLKPGPNQQSTIHMNKQSKNSDFQTTDFKSNSIHINKRRIQYDRWDFYVTVRRDTGLRVFNVHFANISLIAEAGLDETVTSYWGKSPFIQSMTSLESMFGIGGMTSELSPDLDCPKNAIYLPVKLITSGEIGPKLIKNGICLFEWKVNPYGGPLRRHYEFHINNHFGNTNNAIHTNFGHGLSNSALVLRTISTLFNYDYIFDIIFYSSGVIEFTVTPTGYIHVDVELNSFQYNIKYGYLCTINPFYMVLHHHLFHYKIDIDIINKENFFKIINIHGSLLHNQINNNNNNLIINNHYNKINNTELLWITINIPKTELQAKLTTQFELPKQYLICSINHNINKTNDQCLMIINKGQIKTIFNDEHTKSFAWSRHQLYVTQQHDNESFASSIFNGVDLNSPVVDFTKFSSNNESIFNEDLVLWLTMGNYHIPRHEDLPNTATSGGPLSILILPHNLFTYSPDAFSCNRFYTEELDEWITGPQMKEDCQIEPIPML